MPRACRFKPSGSCRIVGSSKWEKGDARLAKTCASSSRPDGAKQIRGRRRLGRYLIVFQDVSHSHSHAGIHSLLRGAW